LQAATTGDYAAGNTTSARGNNHPYYENVFPALKTAPAAQGLQVGGLDVGTIGFAWRNVIVNKTGSTVEWFIDGLKIATVTNVTFTSSNIFIGLWDSFSSLSGDTNLTFAIVDNVRVEVPAIPPSIFLQPLDVAVKLTSNATFTVTAAALPAPSYQWRFNNVPIGGATASSYTRLNVQTNDVGNYSVLVTNVAGSLASSNAALLLTPPQRSQFQLMTLLPDGTLKLGFTGEPGAAYTIEVSTNLADWDVFTNLVNTNGTVEVNAGQTADYPQRFFRTRLNQ
jgi:hypothetical protein